MNGLLICVGAVAGAVGGAMLSANHCRKPRGEAGRRVLRSMNNRHSGVTDWGLAQVRIGESFRILDVGCGGGRTMPKMAALASRGRRPDEGVRRRPSANGASDRRSKRRGPSGTAWPLRVLARRLRCRRLGGVR